MDEVKKSKGSGIEYMDPVILSKKKRVYSKALLMRILHDHEETNDIVLKIGRYNYSGKPESDSPKSELTLTNEELNNLIQYLSNNYDLLRLGEGKYIEVSKLSDEAIDSIKTLLLSNPNVIEELLDKGILSSELLVVADSIQKKRDLVVFEEKIDTPELEKYWQDWFLNHKWVFGSDYVQILDERHIDTDHIADYLMKSYDGFVDIIEIKKPNGIDVWSNSKDHGNYIPSSELVKAITQCINYLHAIEMEANSVKFQSKIKNRIIKPRCTLIIGRSNEWNDEQYEAFRLLNSAYSQITILTYDFLLERAKYTLGITGSSEEYENDSVEEVYMEVDEEEPEYSDYDLPF